MRFACSPPRGSAGAAGSRGTRCGDSRVRSVSAQDEITGETLAAVSRELVRLTAEHYGKGATEAKAYVFDDWLFCVLKGGMTTVERTLLEHGEGHLVRQVRMRFQANMDDSFMGVVRRVTGHEVRGYVSQVMFDPDVVFEIFLLGERVS